MNRNEMTPRERQVDALLNWLLASAIGISLAAAIVWG